MSEIPSQKNEFDPSGWTIFDPLGKFAYSETDLNKDKIAGRSIRDFLDDIVGSGWTHDQSDYEDENSLQKALIEANNNLAEEANMTANIDDEIQRQAGEELRHPSMNYALHDGVNVYGKINREPFEGSKGVIRVSPGGVEKVKDLLGDEYDPFIP